MGKKKNVEKSQPVAQPEPAADVAETKDKKSKKGAKTEAKVAPQSNQQKNVGKTKQIKKEEKPAKPQKQEPVVEKTEKKPKTGKKQETNVQIFTPEFYAKLNNFQTYYKQVLELKSSANNTELSHELTTVNNRVRDELQTASSNILKQELISLQSWIETQQKRLQSEIDSINACYENNKKALQSTGSFAADEITSQLKPIQDRASQKQATFDHYGVLLARSRNIYAEAPAAKPQEEEKVEQVNNNNDNDDNDDLDVL